MTNKTDKEFEDKIRHQVDSLDKRIKDAREDQEEYEVEQYGVSAEETPDEKRGKRASSEFLGSVMGGGVLGFLIDKFFDTAPWGIMFFILMGFVSGVYRANALMKKNE